MQNEGNCFPITCKKALNKVQGRFPYHYDLNVYRGCKHGCQYCFAIYSHQYIENGCADFFRDVYVKTNIVEELEKQLSSRYWKHEVINLGGVTDSYQPAEAQYQIMPEIWKLLIRYKNPAIISTKSDLILRDFDFIAELSTLTDVNIAMTITTVDEKIRGVLEPYSSPAAHRFAALKEFREKTNACVGVHMMPIIPCLTDSDENLEAIFAQAKSLYLDYILPAAMNLRGQTRQHFMAFITRYFPQYQEKIASLYRQGHLDKAYKEQLYRKVHCLMRNYQMTDDYRMQQKIRAEKIRKKEPQQLHFFD